MPGRADILVGQSISVDFSGAGTNYPIQTPTGVQYLVYIDTSSDVVYRKSTNGGLTWSDVVTVFSGTVTQLSVWYDRWSNIAAGLIHCAYSESATDDTLYRTINTESSDALSTQTTIFAGASTGVSCHLSITRAVGGNVYCKTVIDNGAEGGFFRLPNANVPNGAWDAARTVDEAIAAGDQMILLPDYDAADTQDIMAIFWDTSASEISRKLYDDSANSWAETSIAGSMTLNAASNAFPHFAVAMDITNTRHILVAWSNVDTLNADLRCWTVDSGAITEVTNVVLNSTDDQGLCAITLDTATGYWWVFYGGKSDGSETWPTAINLYCKCSTDSGSTWSEEYLLSTKVYNLTWLISIPRTLFGTPTPPPAITFNNTGPTEIYMNQRIANPKAAYLLGV